MKILKGHCHGDVCYVLVKMSQILIKVSLLKHEIALRAPRKKQREIVLKKTSLFKPASRFL